MSRQDPGRIILGGIGFPAVVTASALVPAPSTTVAALVYVLAVMGAAAAGGLHAGILAAFLSFLGLNFFFTDPLHTFRVERLDDVVALGVFLVVATVVATLLSTAIEQRTRAERREREARLLHEVGSRLLLGAPVDGVLRYLAQSFVELFGLERCEVRTDATGSPVVVATGSGGDPDAATTVIPMLVQEHEVGRIAMVPPPDRSGLTPLEMEVAASLAGQVGLALEGVRLAGEADRARTDAETSTTRAALFSSVTHDLRTPLASITASVTNLLDDSARITDVDRKEHLETIREEADRLNRLVGNLLHLARVRAGALTPQKQPASINDIAEGVVARLQPILSEHTVRLVLREQIPDIPIDVDQLDQVLTNLIENAVRHGRPGSEIQVSTARWQRWIEVRVVDHGPGIPKDDRERVFEPFVRRRPSREGGTGLGLSIARALIDAHAGHIWIEGAPGGGTTVAFRLPVNA